MNKLTGEVIRDTPETQEKVVTQFIDIADQFAAALNSDVAEAPQLTDETIRKIDAFLERAHQSKDDPVEQLKRSVDSFLGNTTGSGDAWQIREASSTNGGFQRSMLNGVGGSIQPQPHEINMLASQNDHNIRMEHLKMSQQVAQQGDIFNMWG